MPIVTVQQSPRDIEVKRRLVAGVTEAFVDAYGIAPESVQVFIHEVDHDNWAKAGILASDRSRAHALLAEGAARPGTESGCTFAVGASSRCGLRQVDGFCVHIWR